jgi:mannose-1-phosphate guanylyltransferase
MHLPIGTERGENDWAVILAGGDGTRLKALTRRTQVTTARSNSAGSLATRLSSNRHARFWEKPEAMLARSLLRQGCLWNSFVMVGAVKTLLEIIEKALPEMYRAFERLPACFNGRDEVNTANKLYEKLGETNFSHQVLAKSPEQLAVNEVIGVKWNELGEPKRVMDSLIMQGQRPYWADFPLTHTLEARI